LRDNTNILRDLEVITDNIAKKHWKAVWGKMPSSFLIYIFLKTTKRIRFVY